MPERKLELKSDEHCTYVHSQAVIDKEEGMWAYQIGGSVAEEGGGLTRTGISGSGHTTQGSQVAGTGTWAAYPRLQQR